MNKCIELSKYVEYRLDHKVPVVIMYCAKALYVTHQHRISHDCINSIHPFDPSKIASGLSQNQSPFSIPGCMQCDALQIHPEIRGRKQMLHISQPIEKSANQINGKHIIAAWWQFLFWYGNVSKCTSFISFLNHDVTDRLWHLLKFTAVKDKLWTTGRRCVTLKWGKAFYGRCH